jgi:prepilin-type N-terminal cleavage/methylation domain-containing protein
MKQRKDSGFSLVEILIAIGLLGALSAWMMNIFTQQTKNEKTTATNMDIDAIGNEVRNIMADGLSCAQTFKGVEYNKQEAAPEISKVLADSSVQKRFAVNQKKIGNSSVMITSYDLKTDETYFVPNGTKTGETVLIINYDRGKMIQGTKNKIFKIPLSITLDDNSKIVTCHALASTVNLANICNAFGRSVDSSNKKCSPPTIFIKGDTPIHDKAYAHCEGNAGAGEHILDTWTSTGTGSVKIAWSGVATDTSIIWKVYKNNDTLYNVSGAGISSDVSSLNVDVKAGDVLKHTVFLSGGTDNDCVSGGSFSVSVDLINM